VALPGSASLSTFAGDGRGAVTGDAVPGAVTGFFSLVGEGGTLACRDASDDGAEGVDVAPLPVPTGTVSRGGLMAGGIVAGVETRSVTGDIRTDLSLYPTRNPSEKKIPQTATPAKKTRIRCRVESPLASRGEFIFIFQPTQRKYSVRARPFISTWGEHGKKPSGCHPKRRISAVIFDSAIYEQMLRPSAAMKMAPLLRRRRG